MDDSIIVQRIRKRMKELGINPRKLAEKSNVGKSFVYDVLSGKSRNPTSSKLGLISKELGVSISYLVGDNDVNIDMQKYILGYSLDQNSSAPKLLLSKSYFNLLNKDDLNVLPMSDNSMEPILLKQDLTIVNMAESKGIPVGIFALKFQENIIIRRLEHVVGSNKIRVIAENKDYLSCEEEIGKLDIIGKVKYFFRAL
ncbi:MAG: helix-turn-helix domain-containing protein [Rickettsiaceae bacterium H1]|nr:helix-turn-helix domain-containing protein [Rickettsiaceae bacterium H1]